MQRFVREGSLVATALVLLGAALLASTFGAQYADLGGAFSPMFFPRILLSCLLGLALLNLVAEIRGGAETASARLGRVAVAAVLSVAFLVLMPRIGFFFSGAAFSALLLIVLGVRAPVPLLATALGVPAALVALFNHVLRLPLPTSPYTWMF